MPKGTTRYEIKKHKLKHIYFCPECKKKLVAGNHVFTIPDSWVEAMRCFTCIMKLSNMLTRMFVTKRIAKKGGNIPAAKNGRVLRNNQDRDNFVY